MSKTKVLLSLFCGTIAVTITGCGNNSSSSAVPAPTPAKLTANQQKLLDKAQNMSAQQQEQFFRKNPELLRNPTAMRKLQEVMQKKAMSQPQQQGRRQRPPMPSGRPDIPSKR